MMILRQTLLFFSVFGLIQTPVPSISRAEAAPSKFSQDIDDVMELLPPARSGETLAEFYDRLSPRMPAWMRVEFVDYLSDKYSKPMPSVKVEGRTATFTGGANKVVLRIQEAGDNELKMFLNDQEVRESDGQSVKSLHDRVAQILQSDSSKKMKKGASLLWSMAVPSAYADIDWMPILMGTAVVGLGIFAFMQMQNNKKQQKAAALKAMCPYGKNECCIISGNYVAGCCNFQASLQPGVQRWPGKTAAECVAPTTATSSTSTAGTGTPIFKATSSVPASKSPVFLSNTMTAPEGTK